MDLSMKLKQDQQTLLKKTIIMGTQQSSGSLVDYGRAFQEGVNSARSMFGNRSLRRRSPSDAVDKPPKRQAIANIDDQEKPTVVLPQADELPEDDDDDDDDEEALERKLNEMRRELERMRGQVHDAG